MPLEILEKVKLDARSIDETGNVYGSLTVLYPVNIKRYTWWACECECGEIKIVRGSRLRNGKATHCGCKFKHTPYKEYVVGKKYNMLTVISFAYKNHHNYSYYLCKCDCGKEKIILIDNVVKGLIKSCGCLRGKSIGDYIVNHKRVPFEQSSIYSMYKGYENSAAKRLLPFELSMELFGKLIKQNCHYCGSEPSPYKTKLRKSDLNAVFVCNGIDRIDNSLGYIPKNVVACCFKCNKMKSISPASEFIDHAIKISYFQMLKNKM